MRQRGERLLEVRDSLSIGGTRERLGARLSKVANRLVPSLRPEGVVRQPLDLLGEPTRMNRFDRLHDLSVQHVPAVLEHASVGYIVRKRVLERVLQVGEEARLVEEFRCLKMAETASQLILSQAGDTLQERQGHVLADHGGRLQQALLLDG